MNSLARVLAVLVALTAMVACNGCGTSGQGSTSRSGNHSVPTTSTAQKSSSPTTAPTIASSPGLSFVKTLPVTTSGGFSFRVAVDIAVSRPTINGYTAPIGKLDVHLPTSGTVNVTNATPGKNAYTFAFQHLVVGGLFKSTSPVCPLLGVASVQITAGSDEGSYCWVSYGNGEYTATEYVRAGATFSLAVSGVRSAAITTATTKQVVSDITAGPVLWGLGVTVPFWGLDESSSESTNSHTPRFTDDCILSGGTELFALSDGSAPLCSPPSIGN